MPQKTRHHKRMKRRGIKTKRRVTRRHRGGMGVQNPRGHCVKTASGKTMPCNQKEPEQYGVDQSSEQYGVDQSPIRI